jgi:hypothetical protein
LKVDSTTVNCRQKDATLLPKDERQLKAERLQTVAKRRSVVERLLLMVETSHPMVGKLLPMVVTCRQRDAKSHRHLLRRVRRRLHHQIRHLGLRGQTLCLLYSQAHTDTAQS